MTEVAVGMGGVAVIAARAGAHAAGMDRYAALVAGGVPEGAWDAAHGAAYCVAVVGLQLAAVSVAPALVLAAALSWGWRRCVWAGSEGVGRSDR